MKAKVLIALFVLGILSFTAPISFGQPTQVSYRWTKTIGSSLEDYGNSIATDTLGNIYVTGHFSATAKFGLDFGTTDIKASAGEADIFITKINPNDTYGWTKRIGGISRDEGHAITTDLLGSVYVTESFRDSVNYGLDFGTTEEKDTERNRIRTNRLISGLGLATSWIATVIVDSLVWDGYRQYTLVPVIGPWITLVKMASNEDQGWPGAKELLFLSGVAQTGFATYFIISLARHPKPRETKNVAIWTNFNSINLRIQF